MLKTLRADCHPITSDRRAAASRDTAIPTATAPVLTPFMMATSLGLNHLMSIGPLAVNNNAMPNPYAPRRSSMTQTLGTTLVSTINAMRAEPAVTAVRRPMRETMTPPRNSKEGEGQKAQGHHHAAHGVADVIVVHDQRQHRGGRVEVEA